MVGGNKQRAVAVYDQFRIHAALVPTLSSPATQISKKVVNEARARLPRKSSNTVAKWAARFVLAAA